MIFVWAFNIILWMIKLPFYLLPDSSFLPLPTVITDAVYTLGGYTHWVVYILGTTGGDAFTALFAWMTPIVIAVYLWKLLFHGLGKATYLIRGGGGSK